MYIPAIATVIIGVILFACQLTLCLKDYSIVINTEKKHTYLIPNILGIIGSILLILLGIVCFVIINNQL